MLTYCLRTQKNKEKFQCFYYYLIKIHGSIVAYGYKGPQGHYIQQPQTVKNQIYSSSCEIFSYRDRDHIHF